MRRSSAWSDLLLKRDSSHGGVFSFPVTILPQEGFRLIIKALKTS
jgi:hypothetical protein